MTHKNKTRNFLAGALATASVATLMLGTSTAFAAADRTAVAVDAAFGTGASWAPGAVPPADGNLLLFSTATPANGSIVADVTKNVMLNLNGVNAAKLKVDTTKDAIIGGIINTGAAVTTGLAVTIGGTGKFTAGKGAETQYGAAGVLPGNYGLNGSNLSTVNFTGTGPGIFEITTPNFNSAVKFTTTTGTGKIQLNTTGIVLSSDIGTSATVAPIAIEAKANSSSTFTGNLFLGTTDGIKLDAGSTIELKGDNYKVSHVHGLTAAGQGTLRFTNGGAVSLATTSPAGNEIKTLVVDGSTELTLTGTDGIKFQTLAFTGTGGTAPILTLPATQTIGAHSIKNITSTRGITSIPEVRFSGADQIIAATDVVGDANNMIKFRFMDADDTTPRNFTVKAPNFFGEITTNVNGVGHAVLQAAGGGKVYGLGSGPNHQLATALFKTNTVNFGNTYVKNSTINDNTNVELGETIVGGVKLGTNSGGTTLNFRDPVSIVGDVTIEPGSSNNTVNFAGSAIQMGNFGAPTNRITDINFKGAAGTVANLSNSSMYGTNIDFGNTAINVSGGDAILSGTSKVNAPITLGNNKVTFQDKQGTDVSTLGSGTSISTNVFNNNGTITAGWIYVNTAVKIDDNAHIVVNPSIDGNVPLLFTVPLIKAGPGGSIIADTTNSSIDVSASTGNPYAKYAIQTSDNQNFNLVSISNASVAVPQDFAAAGITDPTDIANAALLTSATSGDALTFVTNTSNIPDAATRANAFQRLTNSNNTQIASVNQGLLFGSDMAIISRTADTALQVDRNEIGKDAQSAGGCDRVAGAPMGAWLTPIYSQATQKAKGGNPGYKVKSGGAILGLDTEANDNMIIGAAATVLSSDMKMKDYKAGDKAKVNSFMFSVYGAQELVRDFFVQGVASFSTSKIKGKERRLVPTSINANGYETAHAHYGSMGFSGQVLLGYNAKPVAGVFITPVAGVRYSKINDEAYKENGTTYQNKWVSKKSVNKVDAIFGIQVESNIQKRDGAIVPEAHGYITRKLSGKTGQVQSSLSGMPGEFIARNDTTGKTFYNVGLGAKVMSGQMEYGAGYDAYLAPKYVAHQGSLKVRVNF